LGLLRLLLDVVRFPCAFIGVLLGSRLRSLAGCRFAGAPHRRLLYAWLVYAVGSHTFLPVTLPAFRLLVLPARTTHLPCRYTFPAVRLLVTGFVVGLIVRCRAGIYFAVIAFVVTVVVEPVYRLVYVTGT
jgi:hypothetical protein